MQKPSDQNMLGLNGITRCNILYGQNPRGLGEAYTLSQTIYQDMQFQGLDYHFKYLRNMLNVYNNKSSSTINSSIEIGKIISKIEIRLRIINQDLIITSHNSLSQNQWIQAHLIISTNIIQDKLRKTLDTCQIVLDILQKNQRIKDSNKTREDSLIMYAT